MQDKRNFVKKSMRIAILISIAINYTAVAHAYSDALISSKDGKPMFEVLFADQGEVARPQERSTYTLSDRYKTAIGDGLQYWADVLGAQAQNNKPIQILVGTMNDSNASANSYTNRFYGGHLYISDAIQAGQELRWMDLRDLDGEQAKPHNGAFANITIGKYLGARREGFENGWYVGAVSPVPENAQATDLLTIVRHEMGHSLGIASYVAEQAVSGGSIYYFQSPAGYKNSWSSQLVDKNGNYAKPYMQIVTSDQFADIQASDPTVRVEDFFILDEGKRAYFVGEHVSEVLNGATFDGVDGLPVNGWEAGRPELSHLQTAGMMSHSFYSNYTSFVEAELAVMQDLGYRIDRRNFFGYSVYDDGQTIVNTNGYFARNAEGTAYLPGQYNTAALGVGLHVYGSNNNIIQAADIMTVGSGAVGVRVDGSGNVIKLAKGNAIHADGARGIGMLVAYGRNHELTQDGAVTANGVGGVGVRFDFGDSIGGAVDEYRGSYIRYHRVVQRDSNASDFGEVVGGGNIGFEEWGADYPATPELDGALVKNYNLNGYLSGSQQAILIGKNAFVENINIGQGAQIYGDITSQWKHFQTDEGVYDDNPAENKKSLKLRYQGFVYDYDDYVPGLATNLNFNADIAYSGNINGSDNMRLRVDGHELSYSGKADVIDVNIAADAGLYGGSYTVNRQRIKNTQISIDGSTTPTNIAEDALDTGNFVSRGTIGALNQNGRIVDMQIAANANELGNIGDFVADGKIRFTAQNEQIGRISIDKFATVALGQSGGFELTFDRSGTYLPGHTYSADQIVYVDGVAQNILFSGVDSYQTGLLNAAYDTGSISFKVSDNLGVRSGRQQMMLDIVEGIRSSSSSLNAGYAPLYNLDAIQAKESLTDIYGGLQSDLVTSVQKDRYLAETVYNRLRAPDYGSGSIWFNMQKGWESLGTDEVRDQTIYGSIGMDRPMNNRWTWGWMLAYGKHDINKSKDKGTIHDLRLAAYGGYRVDGFELATYLGYGWQNNNSNRTLRNLNSTASSKYRSNILSLGAKASYDLQYNKDKIWHISPYAELVVNHYNQDGWTESGAGVYNQLNKGFSNNYITAGLGLELRRELQNKGSYAFNLGYRRVLSGYEAGMPTYFAVDNRTMFQVQGTTADRDILTTGVQGNIRMRKNLSLSGEVFKDWGKTTDNTRVSLQLKWEY